MTRKEEAENYIIQKYRINENYRVDNEETRAYMRNDVHSNYQQEYELYLFGFNNGFDKGYHRQRERCDEEMQDLRNQFVLDGERIKQLGIENEALKQSVEEGEEIIAELKAQIEKMKCCGNCKHYYCSNDTKDKCDLRNPKENKCGFNICEIWEIAE